MSREPFLVITGAGKNQHWLAGMRWEPREKTGTFVPGRKQRAGRKNPSAGITVHAATRLTGRPGHRVKMYGDGRVAAHHRHRRFYSLALAFSLQVRNGYGVYRLNSTDYVFLASINGLPAVMADKTGNTDAVQQSLALFTTMNEAPADGWTISAPPENPAEIGELLGALTERNKRRCRVFAEGRTLRMCLAGFALLAGAAGAVAGWESHQTAPEPTLTPAEIQARARLLMARTTPARLTRPWASQIPVPALLKGCSTRQNAAPVSLEGWLLKSGTCSPDGVTLLYQLLPGGTASAFQTRAEALFGIAPTFNLKEGGREATVSLPLPDHPTTDEPPANILNVLSWFQQRQITLNLNRLTGITTLPGQSGAGATPDWDEYEFSFKSQLPPELLLNGMDTRGVRISLIRFDINGSAFSYTTEGHLYASTK